MHAFPIATVKNYHKCRSLKQYKLLHYSSEGKSKMSLMEVKSRCVQTCIPLEFLGEDQFPCLFQLLMTAHIPCVVIFQQSHHSNSDSFFIYPSLTLIPLCPSFIDPYDFIELTQIVQDNLPIPKSLIYSYLQVSFATKGNILINVRN